MITARLRREDGFLMGTAMLLLLVLMAIGLAAVAYVDSQQNSARQERTRESSLTLTEAALNGQVFQLARVWPSQATPFTTPCTSAAPSDSPTSFCPAPASLSTGYGGPDFGTCTGTSTVPWTTTVRDNGTGSETYYNRAIVDAQLGYDANQDGQLWVRSEGWARCRRQIIVARVRQGFTPLSFPRNVLTANWFRTTNQGNKVIVQTSSEYQSKPADLSVRCAGLDTSQCLDFDASKGQVSPNTATRDPLTPTQTVTDAALDSFRRQAKANGSYYATGCPPTLTGQVVFAEDMTGCSYNNGGNTQAAPGFLVIAKGSLTLTGNGIFYGVIYAANRGGIAYPTPVISLQGTAGIFGAVTIDGAGGIFAGASKVNLVFDPRGFGLVKVHAGAGIVQNSWRSLPLGQ
jgi:hypothetical protein